MKGGHREMRTLLFAFVVLFLGGAAISLAAGDAASTVDVYDGFETPTLSTMWSTDRLVPGAVVMQTNIVRAGHSAAQITLRPSDKFEASLNGGKDSERDELLEAKKLVSREGVAYEQSFSDFIPVDFPIAPVRLVIAQWKQRCPDESDPCGDDSPVFAVRYVSGTLFITRQIDSPQITLFETKEDLRGKWTDFKFQTLFTTNATGFLRAWLNGKQVVDYTGPTAYPENQRTGYRSPSYFYFKMGLYRDLMPVPMTIYIDEYRKRQLPDSNR
jgi:hypothetical protein